MGLMRDLRGQGKTTQGFYFTLFFLLTKSVTDSDLKAENLNGFLSKQLNFVLLELKYHFFIQLNQTKHRTLVTIPGLCPIKLEYYILPHFN
jgi:hypothetical protein